MQAVERAHSNVTNSLHVNIFPGILKESYRKPYHKRCNVGLCRSACALVRCK